MPKDVNEVGMTTQANSNASAPGLALAISVVKTTTTNSTPTSPGSASPSSFRGIPLNQDQLLRIPEIEPPARPKSTPFSWQETPSSDKLMDLGGNCEQTEALLMMKDVNRSTETSKLSKMIFSQLPTEIHELVLDHLFGVRASTASNASVSRGWSTALRHSRRRQLSDVALVNRMYRELVQGRLFKHIKVQGTRPSIAEAISFFCDHPHLQKHTRHIEVWSPVWERRAGAAAAHVILPPTTPDRTTLVRVMNAHVAGFEPSSNVASAYQMATRNSSLYEIFSFVDMIFPGACILTLEGGHCKKPPMVRHFPEVKDLEHGQRRLPTLGRIRTLVLKSAWNLMRTEEDFDAIMAAVPNLQEWHSSYAKPKSKSYLNISAVVLKLPPTLRHLNISLESTYSREALSPRFWRKIYPSKTHICIQLAHAIPQLESFTYSGRVCHHLFQDVARLADPDWRGNSRLKMLDLTVKNCCRPSSVFVDGSGINDPSFISALEELVVSSVASLRHLKTLELLRIRFVDLESPMPLLNPFFQLKDNKCTGLWSDRILFALSVARPEASYIELSEDFGGITYDKEGKLVSGEKTSKTRPLSMKVSSYEPFSTIIAIN